MPRNLLLSAERHSLAIFLILFATISLTAQNVDNGWPTYGGDAGGKHYSSSSQIRRENVSKLHQVWLHHTHALDSHRPGHRSAAFESTSVLFHDELIFTTPFSEIQAVNPATGEMLWNYAATAESDFSEGNLDTSRGVAVWEDSSHKSGLCSSRVFVGTLTGKIHAVDANNGKPCADFGKAGVIDLREGLKGYWFGITSAPTVVGDVLITGTSMPDNQVAIMPKGTVRGFDVRTGHLLWTWDPIPANSKTFKTGAANAWSTISADPELGLIFVPTGSASVDYYGGMRPGDNKDADSVVALDAKTGKKVWAFQTVHHNLWDYDVPSEPLLFKLHNQIPAVAVTTKMGMVFVLDRRTGAPLYPVEERSVPKTDVPGETTSPTQPFSSLPPFASIQLQPSDLQGGQRSERNAQRCRDLISKLRYDGIYTPPSMRGSLMFPGNVGGVNWGGPALDPQTNIIYANINRVPYSVALVPRKSDSLKNFWGRHKWRLRQLLVLLAVVLIVTAFLRYWKTTSALVVLIIIGMIVMWWDARPVHPSGDTVLRMMEGAFDHDGSPMLETPYELRRDPIKDYDGVPCIAPPWGEISAINLNTGQKLWERPLGQSADGKDTGTPNLGGPIVTAGGLIFDASTRDSTFRAFDAQTGDLLWQTNLPVPAQATPMTYIYKGKQYIVLADGGHGLFGTPTGDSVIAFAL